MPSDPRAGNRRLNRAARPLRPATAPYYMSMPRPGIERSGPGWYWTPASADAPEYLAYNSVDAELRLRELAAALDAGDAGQAAA
jgi:hypothetical protein